VADGNPDRYKARGVSASKREVADAVRELDRGLVPGAFCNIYENPFRGESASTGIIVHADGVGTKVAVAYMIWKETGDLSVWEGLAQDAVAMNVDDCACVGATDTFLLSNSIARNGKRIPGEVVSAIVRGFQKCAEWLSKEGTNCRVVGGETADCGDLVRTINVDATVVTALAVERVIDAARMVPGDLIVGLSSSGQARWERSVNSGIGSNGLTNARHELLMHEYGVKFPETVAPEMSPDLVYSGRWSLSDVLPGRSRMSVGEALLSPTRIYVPLLRPVFEECGGDIHGVIHCTGGGQTKIGRFGRSGARGLRFVKDSMFDPPEVFATMLAEGRLTSREMYGVYNMGHLMELVVREEAVPVCLRLAADCGIEARIVGRVEESESKQNEVQVQVEGEELLYVCDSE
jgi:phosphoribosylformylglycinamidine cyclo-ligase